MTLRRAFFVIGAAAAALTIAPMSASAGINFGEVDNKPDSTFSMGMSFDVQKAFINRGASTFTGNGRTYNIGAYQDIPDAERPELCKTILTLGQGSQVNLGTYADSCFVGASLSLSGESAMTAARALAFTDTELTLATGSKLEAGRVTGKAGVTTFDLSDGSAATMTSYDNQAGATTTINLGSADEAEGAAASNFIAQTYVNEGETAVNIYNGSEITVTEYVNSGDTTIHADAGTTCTIKNVQMLGGDIVLMGTGAFMIGCSAPSAPGEPGGDDAEVGASGTVFTVSSQEGVADTTCLDISFLNPETSSFTVDTASSFTLVFTDEILQGVAEKGVEELSLTLIKGYTGFNLSEEALNEMLCNTLYVYGQVATFAVVGESNFTVTNASYEMVGNDLVWMGTVSAAAVPEPTTATLSLLALGGLAARRRRK